MNEWLNKPGCFGALKLGEQPIVLAVVTGETKPQDVISAIVRGASGLEFRLDQGFEIRDGRCRAIDQMIDREFTEIIHSVPRMMTVRIKSEGGAWPDEQHEERMALIDTYKDRFHAIDLELRDMEKHGAPKFLEWVKNNGVVINGSGHNFETTVSDDELDYLDRLAEEFGVDVLKVAMMAKSRNDIHRLNRFLIGRRSKVAHRSVIPMGPLGKFARIAFPLLEPRSVFTYASIGETVAPGQFSVMDTRRLLNELGGR